MRPEFIPELGYIAMMLAIFVGTFILSNGLARLRGYRE